MKNIYNVVLFDYSADALELQLLKKVMHQIVSHVFWLEILFSNKGDVCYLFRLPRFLAVDAKSLHDIIKAKNESVQIALKMKYYHHKCCI